MDEGPPVGSIRASGEARDGSKNDRSRRLVHPVEVHVWMYGIDGSSPAGNAVVSRLVGPHLGLAQERVSASRTDKNLAK